MRRSPAQLNPRSPRQRRFVAAARAHADHLGAELRQALDGLDRGVELVVAQVDAVLALHDRVAAHLEVLDGRSARAAARRVRADLRGKVMQRLEEALSATRRARGGAR